MQLFFYSFQILSLEGMHACITVLFSLIQEACGNQTCTKSYSGTLEHLELFVTRWTFLRQLLRLKAINYCGEARNSISDVLVDETFAVCLVMIASVMANLSVINLISLWFVLKVLNTLRSIYHKSFFPF